MAPARTALRAMPAGETCDAPSPPHRRRLSLPSQPTDDRTGSVGAVHAPLVPCSGEGLVDSVSSPAVQSLSPPSHRCDRPPTAQTGREAKLCGSVCSSPVDGPYALAVSPAVPSPSGAASISPESLRPSAADLVEQFLKRLGEARTPAEFGSLAPQRVVAAIPSRTCPPSVSVSHTNGRVSVNNRRPTVLK